MTEIRTTSSTGGEKWVKPERYDLIPVEALAKVAQLYGRGAEKYDEHNWRKGYEWSKSYAAMQRHGNAFWAGEDFDPEMQLPHLASVVFHALTLMTFMEEQPQFDNRFKSGKFDGPPKPKDPEEIYREGIEALKQGRTIFDDLLDHKNSLRCLHGEAPGDVTIASKPIQTNRPLVNLQNVLKGQNHV